MKINGNFYRWKIFRST